MHKFNNYIYKLIDSDEKIKVVQENEYYTSTSRADGYYLDTETSERIGNQFYLYATNYDEKFNLLEEPIYEENHYEYHYFGDEDYAALLNIDDIRDIIDIEEYFKLRSEVLNESNN